MNSQLAMFDYSIIYIIPIRTLHLLILKTLFVGKTSNTLAWTCQEYDSFGEGGKEHLKAKKVKAHIEKARGVSRPGRLRCLVICICSAFCGNLLTFSFDMVI